MLPGEKELVRFTEAEGADGHCQPLARSLTAQRFFDFLDDHVGLTACLSVHRALRALPAAVSAGSARSRESRSADGGQLEGRRHGARRRG